MTLVVTFSTASWSAKVNSSFNLQINLLQIPAEIFPFSFANLVYTFYSITALYQNYIVINDI
jgi:hypothetical protein